MLPFDNRPWARALARTVVVLSLIAAVAGAYFLYNMGELRIPEVVGILLLLLTIIPPNLAIVLRKSNPDESAAAMRLHPH